ncbi:hypothetical protein [Butyrivibrio sp. INlla16]|jgi:hypothetical protein|uniref:hypothetical protein n=1 Tax=Butyrivibrio sp. INlla16 TaxID=1520807 RepID=UPI00088A16E1|nr:hypothetical protein [Butyrivibrio sp. INlla16]MBE5824616.1 hypothetical protein [Butyrivibrio sp.]SDB44058.1 hypothetical protein SAMN02910263_02145 [Butyrivibrio sp. INlla16]
MKLFFDADKYLLRVESPRINKELDRKQQILAYVDRYFVMFRHEYFDEVYDACVKYIDEMFEDDSDNDPQISAEVQAVTIIIKGLRDYAKNGLKNQSKYLKVLVAGDVFKFYSGMISKSLDLGVIDKKQARRRIEVFYKECELE